VSKEAYSQLKKTISKLRRKKIPNKTDKHILAKEFEKNLALLNKRLDSTEKKLRTSNAFWQASEPFGSLLEKNHPTVLKYASIDAVRAADQ